MNLDMLSSHRRSRVFHNDQWPADSSTVTDNIDRFVMMVWINSNKLADLAGTPQPAELSNESGRESSDTNDETVDANYEGGRSVDCRARGRLGEQWESSSCITEHFPHLQHLVE